jgi:SAM-dependent methyltransferase
VTHETGKSMIRRSCDARFATRWLVGDVIDIGSGDDGLNKYFHMFPQITAITPWDKENGDAMTMRNVVANTYDCVHSSHCLEHLADPFLAMESWIRICRPGGHLIIVVPDFAQYEQGFWPSRFNAEHGWCFSISGRAANANHIILFNEPVLFDGVDVLKIELVERGYVHGAPPFDQSLLAACEPAIEIICRKQ